MRNNELILNMFGNQFMKCISASASWRPQFYGEDTAGMEVVGAEVCSGSLKSSSQEARPERTGDLGRFVAIPAAL